MFNFIEASKNWVNELSASFGALIQYIIISKRKKNKVRFLIFLILSSIFVAFYIIEPIVHYYTIKQPYQKALYAISGLVSIEIVNIIVSFLPDAIRKKILQTIGVKYDNE